MKIKMLGLAAVAVTALAVALVGSALAHTENTKLCKEEACLNHWPSGETIRAALETGTVAKLTSTFLTVECSVSSVEGKTEAEVGSPLPGQITALKFEKCKTSSGTECKVTTEALGGAGSTTIAHTEGSNGSMVVRGTKVRVVCGLVNCLFEGKENTATLKVDGGNPAKALAVNVALSSACGSATWNATYVASAPGTGNIFVGH